VYRLFVIWREPHGLKPCDVHDWSLAEALRVRATSPASAVTLSRVAPARPDTAVDFNWVLELDLARRDQVGLAASESSLEALVSDLRSLGCHPAVICLEPHPLG
jgi:hypothetical protein